MRIVSALVILLLNASLVIAQDQPKIEQSATFVSSYDNDLTIRKVGILPVTDNIDGIYARSIEARLTELLKSTHRWDYVEVKGVGQVFTPLDLEENPKQMQSLAAGTGTDALFAMRASRGPKGVTLHLDLFSTRDGKLLFQEILRDHKQFDTKDILEQTSKLYRNIIKKVPYEGFVLSRQGTRVTVSMGKRDGIAPGTVLTAMLIINAQRHPKFNFVINTEREVLGKIKVEKVDDTLSFGLIVSEKERGTIQKNTKITGLDFIKYDEEQSFLGPTKEGLDMSSDSNKISFGSGPKEWVPTPPPTFGKVGFLFGLGSYRYNMNLQTEGAIKGQSQVFPSIRLDGELWLTPDWNVLASIRQGVLNVGNPISSSEPKSLSIAMSRYSFYIARNILLKGDFFGPKIQFFTGFSRYTGYVDNSTPLGLTTMSYSGLPLGIKGEVPVDDLEMWAFGASIEYFLMTTLNETPQSSGQSNKNGIVSFSLFGSKKLGQRLRGIGALDFEMYNTTFSGAGTRGDSATSASQQIIIFGGGIEYLF